MPKPHTIAIVDDDSFILQATTTLLSTYGFEVESFSSADAFLSAVPESRAACLIIDVQLGASSGIELGRQLAEAGFGFPIIYITASDDEAVQRRAEGARCVALLRKPFSANSLIEALIRAIGEPAVNTQ